MRNLLFVSTKVDFHEFQSAISVRCSSALTYLQRAWLPYEAMRSQYSFKWSINFGILTANGVQVENRHLNRGLSMKSTLLDVFSQMMRRREDLDEARRRRVIREFLGSCVAPTGLEMYDALLSRIS